jgi:multisubunit Na+/H+ antiporter MnhE subunit
MVTVPGAAPAVLRVAELPLPETLPPVAVQFATEIGTPSGLVQLAVKVTVPPGVTLVGFADNDMVGGFFGGNGFTV